MQLSTNPAEIHDAIAAVITAHPKTFGRLGVSRPMGLTVLGLAATGRLTELAAGENEGSVADRFLTGDEIEGLPLEALLVPAHLTGKAAQGARLTTYGYIGAYVAAQLGFGEATREELRKLPGTSALKVQEFLTELPNMAEYRAEIEARKKAAAKRAADVAAVRLEWRFANKHKAEHNEATYADVMEERGLTWEQVQDIIATLTAEAAAKHAEAAAKADA